MASNPGQERWIVVARAATLLLVVATGIAFAAPLDTSATRLASDIGSIGTGLIFVIALELSARRMRDCTMTWLWRFVGLSMVIALGSYGLDPIDEVAASGSRVPLAFRISPWISAAHIVVLAIAGRRLITRASATRVVADSLWVGTGVLGITWNLVGEPTLHGLDTEAAGALSLLASSAVLAALIGIGWSLLSEADRHARRDLLPLVVVSVVPAFMQTTFGYAFHRGQLEYGSAVDFVFPLGFAAMVAAATLAPSRPSIRPAMRPPGRLPLLVTVVPFAAWVVSVLVSSATATHLVVELRWVLVGAIAARLVHLVADNAGLARRLYAQSVTDPLTGLPNRRALGQALELLDGRPVGLLLIDLDRFKTINDTLGHRAGDELIRHVGERISITLGEQWTIARLAGDEFVAYRPGLTDDAKLAEAGRSVIQSLRHPVVFEGAEAWIGASVGTAHTGEGTRAPDLVDVADLALRQAKNDGRGAVVHAGPEVHERARHSAELVEELRAALDTDQIVVHYQPQVDLTSGAMLGVEALVRWDHPTRGLMAPDEFIPIAEASGLVAWIDSLVLSIAVDDLRRWNDLRPRDRLRLSTNMSYWQLARTDVDRQVAATLARRGGVDPSQLVVELTETTLVEEPTLVARRLERLRSIGLGVAVDDFGEGFTSLAHLRRFPVSEVKIDRSMVAELDGSAADERSLAAAIIALGHALGIEVVAEGIETTAQATSLRHLGCRVGQGFLFARPLPAPEIDELLAERYPFADLLPVVGDGADLSAGRSGTPG